MPRGAFFPSPAVGVVSAALGAVASLPARVVMPAADLDASWVGVLHEAFRQRWRFGEDIVFTHGPLGFLAVPVFEPDLFWWLVGVRLLIGAVCGWAVHAMVRDVGGRGWLAPLALVALVPPTVASPDVPLLLPAMLWAATGLWTGRERTPRVHVVLAAVVGVLALVKFTVCLLGVALAALLCVEELWQRRRMPWASIVFAATVCGVWVAIGQRPGDLAAWIRTSWETSSAYSVAMSTPIGPYQQRELVVFAGAAVPVVVLAAWLALRRRGPRLAATMPVAAVGLVLYVVFKLGFVRQDAHVISALFAMPVIAALVGAGTVPTTGRRLKGLAIVAVCLGMASYGYGLRRHFDRLAMPEHYRAIYAHQIRSLADLVQPGRTYARLGREYAAAQAHLQASLPLASLDGTVDLYGHGQGALLAQPVAYQPRPVFQSYGAYTVGLQARNRRALEGSGGVRHVLYDPASIDHRYPLLDDAASVPVLLASFDGRGEVGGYAHLERRARPKTIQRQAVATVVVAIGEDLALDVGDGLVWAEIDLPMSYAGRLASAAFKLPPVYLEVQTADGRSRLQRIVPDVARGGMLVSPLIGSSTELLFLLDGTPPRPAQQVTSIRALVDWPFAYASRVHLRLFRLLIEDAQAGAGLSGRLDGRATGGTS